MGGGSGGHITPLLAVANQIKKEQPSADVHIAIERFSRFSDMFDKKSDAYTLHFAFAGKFRRYYGESLLKRITDIKTVMLNIRDFVFILMGLVEALFLLARLRPSVIFIKGGYVGLPFGLAARLLRIDYVTHDSDTSAGLTNRLIAGSAKYNAVGMPAGAYSYDPAKIVYTGVPVRPEYFEDNDQKKHRQSLTIKPKEKLILVLGGSNGAQRLDSIMHGALRNVLEKESGVRIIHQVGEGNESLYADYPPHLQKRIKTARFLSPLHPFVLAADVIVSRAGATAIAEFAAAKKPVLLVPHPQLAGGHQNSNAEALKETKAAVVVDEKKSLADPSLMEEAILDLIEQSELGKKLGEKIHKLLPGDGAERISQLLIQVAKSEG